MPTTHALPPGFAPPAGADRSASESAEPWSPEALGRLAAHLAGPGAAVLAALDDAALLAAWSATVAAFRDPGSPERRGLAGALEKSAGLSTAGLAAGLEAVLGGVAAVGARAVFERARGGKREPTPRPSGAGLVTVVLAANLPALAVQPLLPLLALRRPVLLKSASREPFFAPAFVAALARRLPALGEAVAAVAWRGGEEALEAPVFAASDRVFAYGDDATLASLARRAPGRLVAYGPKASLAVIGLDVEPTAVAAGLARDIALFDQRGCLSVQAIWTAGDAVALAECLTAEQARLGELWPPGPLDAEAAAQVQQLRLEADLRGLPRSALPLASGTIVVVPEERFSPSPGLRTVRIHALSDLARLLDILAAWRGKLQGAALAGEAALALAPELARLGLSRFAAPGELQSPDATWQNGGVDPLTVLG